MAKVCGNCSGKFEVTDGDRAFYERIGVPEPVKCPRCRLVRRLAERNAKTLYTRKCDFSGKTIISQYRPDVPFPVYEQNIWWGDDWDPMEYGRDYNFERGFFEQFEELRNSVPHMSLLVTGGTLENSEYVNCAGYVKNCYLIGEADYDEDCYYSNRVFHSKNVVDCSTSYDNEFCYECIECMNCQRLFYSQDSKNCHDSYFLMNCAGCQDCIGCINQRHKKYMIFNKQYPKEEYEAHKAAFELDTNEGVKRLRQQTEDFFKTQVHRDVFEEQNQNCIGDHLYNSKNSSYCFDCKDLEDCKYCVRLFGGIKDCMDYSSWGDKAELIYHSVSCGDNAFNLKFCIHCFGNVTNLEYCYHVVRSSDCFGCVGLKRKKFCIFNKQYSEEEYYVLKDKIIEHMKITGEYGKFHPKGFCAHGYNVTLAMDEFPLSKEEATAEGYKWSESVVGEGGGDLVCECGKSFKLIPQEMAFYERLGIPRPEKCQLCRHKARQKNRNPVELWERDCGRCGEKMMSSVGTDRPEIVYCKQCYLAEVY